MMQPPHRASLAGRLGFVGWKLGLGWLIGRRYALLGTVSVLGPTSPPRAAVAGRRWGRVPHRHGDEPPGEERSTRRSLIRFAFAGGDVFTRADLDEPWVADVLAKPQAMVQAHPGPLGVRARRPEPAELAPIVTVLADQAPAIGSGDVWVLEATGDRVPLPVAPDWAWLWPVLALAVWLVGRLRGDERRP